MPTPLNWNAVRQEFIESLKILKNFLKNPIEGMSQVPDWDWQKVLVLQFALNFVCGLFSGLLTRHIVSLITSPFLTPLAGIVLTGVVSLFVSYFCLFYLKREVSLRKIYTLFMFASVPGSLLLIADPLFPPITLVAGAMTVYLFLLGLNRRLTIPKKPISAILWGFYTFFVIYSLANSLSFRQNHNSLKLKATPESLDILERELKGR